MDDMDGSGGMEMNGMMSDGEMMSLNETTGTGFDKMFLEMMIRHHKGAIAMAKVEVAGGKNAQAIKLARSIAETQQVEVREMQSLLTDL